MSHPYRIAFNVSTVLAIFFTAALDLSAAPLVFTRIADNNTPIPGGGGTKFVDLETVPVVSGQSVSFVGDDRAGHRGLYASTLGIITPIADRATPIPGDTGLFNNINYESSARGSDAVFVGYASIDRQGIYARVGGTLTPIADKNTPVPGGPGAFGNFGGLSARFDVDRGAIVFDASYGTFDELAGEWTNQGIFTNLGGPLRAVAVRGMPDPAGGNFLYLHSPTIEGNTIVFRAVSDIYQDAIMVESGGVLSTLVSSSTPLPGLPPTSYMGIGDLSSMKNGRIAAPVGLSTQSPGIYRFDLGEPTLIANPSIPPPGEGTFSNLAIAAIDGDGTVAFEATVSGLRGIYVGDGSIIARVIEANDVLDGRTVSQVRMGRSALDGGTLAFYAEFTDNTSGIYTVPIAGLVPEPGAALLLTMVPVAHVAVRSRRRR